MANRYNESIDVIDFMVTRGATYYRLCLTEKTKSPLPDPCHKIFFFAVKELSSPSSSSSAAAAAPSSSSLSPSSPPSPATAVASGTLSHTTCLLQESEPTYMFPRTVSWDMFLYLNKGSLSKQETDSMDTDHIEEYSDPVDWFPCDSSSSSLSPVYS
jgi:hypothetical protein